ncbi:sigma-70 family RNA polymerase sigma factor [Kitasatospora sp. NPDC090091]|uniref:BACON domain-containing protein n=1 Tax=Kitasatospora sp. NPDC090091 TaxID=3364081 RepID=UPI0037F124E6
MTTSAEAPRDPVLAAYDRQVDGLFTYCLSVLCEQDAAAAALCEVRELAVRHGARLAEPGLVRAWLYSLARYCCLRRLEDGAGSGAGPGAAGTGAGPVGVAAVGGATVAARGGVSEAEAARRRRELASLAWPEAAGTGPEQREALELSVRHRLTPIEVAAVLGLPFDAVRALLASAEAEVGRTRAALLVLGVGSCPELDRLGGAGAESWRDWVLGPALRRELVQHVVDCPTCRGTAERVADEVSAGTAGLSGLPVLGAPTAPAATAPPTAGGGGGTAGGGGTGSVHFLPHAAGPPPGRRAAGPVPVVEPCLRFDQSGFPRHRAPDAGRGLAVRRRVVTTGVLAAVLAAPVVALWAGHRGGGGPGTAAAVSTVRVDDDGRSAGHRPAGPRPDGGPGQGGPAGPNGPGAGGVAPAVAGLELAWAGPATAETLLPGLLGPAVPVPAHGATPLGSPTLVAAPAPASGPGVGAGTGAGRGPDTSAAAGLLTVEAGEYGNRTVLTLTNSGTTEIRWRAVVDAAWLRLSRDAGTLAPGQRITVIVSVDDDLAPTTPWTARIALPPSQAVVTLEGGPHRRGGPTPVEPTEGPTESGRPSPGATPSATPTGGSPTGGGPGGGGSSGGGPTAGPSGSPTPGPTGSPGSPGTTGSPAPTGGAASPTAAPSSPAPSPSASSAPPGSSGAPAAPGPSASPSRSARASAPAGASGAPAMSR